jgi:hypothetical protein
VKRVTQRAGTPALAAGAATVGIAGALRVRKARKPKQRKRLGVHVSPLRVRVPMPIDGSVLGAVTKNLPTDIDSLAHGVSKTGKQVSLAGKQLGKIAIDIQRAGETTDRIGKLMAK